MQSISHLVCLSVLKAQQSSFVALQKGKYESWGKMGSGDKMKRL